MLKYSDKIDKIAGLDSRGFLFGNAMALAVEKPFVPIRKKGKLPGECRSVSYSLEYGQDSLEIQVENLKHFRLLSILHIRLAVWSRETEF